MGIYLIYDLSDLYNVPLLLVTPISQSRKLPIVSQDYTLSLSRYTIPYITLTMSQPSAYTAGPSSLPPSSQPDLSYVGDIFDSNLDPNIDPSLFNSQQTSISLIESEFTQPALLDYSLKRVGPDRRKQFILYDAINDASKAKFIEWWRTTVHGSGTETQRLRWDTKHISDVWENFH